MANENSEAIKFAKIAKKRVQKFLHKLKIYHYKRKMQRSLENFNNFLFISYFIF